MALPDPTTRRTIEKATADLLRDAGVAAPPVRIERLLAHLEVHREFYDLENPSFLQRAVHRLRVGGERSSTLSGTAFDWLRYGCRTISGF